MDAGAAELVDAPRRFRALRRARQTFRDIADMNGLEARPSAVRQRQGRGEARQGGEAVEKIVLRAEHHARADDDGAGEGVPRGGLAGGLAPPVGGGGVGGGADGGDVDQAPRAGRGGGAGYPRRARDVDGVEGPPPGFVEDAHQVDHQVGARDRRRDRRVVADVGGDGDDLPHIAHGAEEPGAFGMARRGYDPRAPPGRGAARGSGR